MNPPMLFNVEDVVMFFNKQFIVKGRWANTKEEVYSNKGNPTKNIYFVVPIEDDYPKSGDEELWMWIPENQLTSV